MADDCRAPDDDGLPERRADDRMIARPARERRDSNHPVVTRADEFRRAAPSDEWQSAPNRHGSEDYG
jgi:hypothetical protein